MNQILKLTLFGVCLMGTLSNISSQSSAQVQLKIPKTSIMAIAPFGGKTVVYQPQLNNGFSVETATDWWINYSSIKGSKSTSTLNVSAVISKGKLPQGYRLIIEAAQDVGKGDGEIGISVGSVVLTDEYQTIISSIGSSYTGKSINHGHQLFFTLRKDDMVEELEDMNAIEISFKLE